MQPKVSSLEWHTDGIHETEYPPYMTQIYCIETPLKGGKTLFLDTTSLWEQLSTEEQEYYRHKTVVYQPIRNKMSKNGCLSLPGKANVFHSPEDDIETNLPVTIYTRRFYLEFYYHYTDIILTLYWEFHYCYTGNYTTIILKIIESTTTDFSRRHSNTAETWRGVQILIVVPLLYCHSITYIRLPIL